MSAESEPETTYEPNPEAETTYEPSSEAESTYEPSSEAESTYEPSSEAESTYEPSSEAESTYEPSSEVETTFEPGSEVEPRPSSESIPEPEGEGFNPSIHGEPSADSIIVPILLFSLLLIIGLTLFTLYKRRHFYKKYGLRGLFGFWWLYKSKTRVEPDGQKKDSWRFCKHLPLSVDEETLLYQAENNQNTVMNVVLMTIPSLVALLICSLTMLLHQYMIRALWPTLVSQPDVNEAVGCFLTPAGMVYAINLGFAYEGALGKNHVYSSTITEVSTIFKETIRLSMMTKASQLRRLELIVAIKYQLIEVIRYFTGPVLSQKQIHCYRQSSSPEIRNMVLKWLASSVEVQSRNERGKASYFDKYIARKLIKINVEIWHTADNMKLIFTKISIIQWIFLEALGYLAFIGVVFISAYSPLCELSMCILTMITISVLLYFIADLDDPFNGIYRMDCSELFELIEELDDVYRDAKITLPTLLEDERKGVVDGHINEKSLPCPPPI